MNLLSRWLEFGAASIPDPPWPEVWAAVARGQASGRGLGEVENLLFRWRFSGWILSLDMDPSTCPVCGDRMSPGGNRPRISCSNRCRQLRVRHKAEGTPTSWGDQVAEARTVRKAVLEALLAAQRASVRHRLLHPGSVVMPPDWTSLQHAPLLPPRCGLCVGEGGRGTACAHTEGGLCLFAGIGRVE